MAICAHCSHPERFFSLVVSMISLVRYTVFLAGFASETRGCEQPPRFGTTYVLMPQNNFADISILLYYCRRCDTVWQTFDKYDLVECNEFKRHIFVAFNFEFDRTEIRRLNRVYLTLNIL